MDPDALYHQLRALISETPQDLAGPGPVTPEMHRWLGRAGALIEQAGDNLDAAALKLEANTLDGFMRQQSAHKIIAVLHRALARTELKAPSATQGAFIPVGASFDIFQVVGKVVREATQDVWFVDAYMNATVLTDFAITAPEPVAVRLLTDSFYTKETDLFPAVERWKKQHVSRRISARLSSARALHDRLIVVDGKQVWALSQSLKDFAGRSPGSVLRVPGDVAAAKVHAYEAIWSTAKPLA